MVIDILLRQCLVSAAGNRLLTVLQYDGCTLCRYTAFGLDVVLSLFPLGRKPVAVHVA